MERRNLALAPLSNSDRAVHTPFHGAVHRLCRDVVPPAPLLPLSAPHPPALSRSPTKLYDESALLPSTGCRLPLQAASADAEREAGTMESQYWGKLVSHQECKLMLQKRDMLILTFSLLRFKAIKMDPTVIVMLIEAIEKLNPEVVKKSNQRQMDPIATLRLIEAIEKLNPEVVKKLNQRQMEPTATLRLIEAIEKLNELNMESPIDGVDGLSERKKSFIEVSKAITLFVGAGINALNVFVVTVVYMSKHKMLGNEGSTNTAPAGVPPTESASTPLSITQSIFILGTLFYFLFTSYVVVVAHAAVHRREWFSKLVVMMILEIFLIYATSMLYAYVFTEGDF